MFTEGNHKFKIPSFPNTAHSTLWEIQFYSEIPTST